MGRNKQGKNKYCLACGIGFYVPKYREYKAKFCSKICQNQTQWEDSRRKYICYGCEIEFTKSPSRIHETKRVFCSMECKVKNAKINSERRRQQKVSAIKKRGSFSGRTIRKWIWNFKEKKCEVCGYNEYDFCLDIHHKDHNPNNNSIENLGVICVICHRKHHKGLIEI